MYWISSGAGMAGSPGSPTAILPAGAVHGPLPGRRGNNLCYRIAYPSERSAARHGGWDKSMARRIDRIAAALGLAVLWVGASGCEPRLRKVYTEHLGQLTGTVFNP